MSRGRVGRRVNVVGWVVRSLLVGETGEMLLV